MTVPASRAFARQSPGALSPALELRVDSRQAAVNLPARSDISLDRAAVMSQLVGIELLRRPSTIAAV